MKKLIYILVIFGFAFILNGCDYMVVPQNHYVSVNNNESDKYITSVFYRYEGNYEEYWSRNLISNYIYSYETYDLLMEEGNYDFKVILEDDYYSYEVDILSVYVYSNVSLDVCLDCYDKKANVKIIKTAKNKSVK
jgi:hypothetical protein